MGVVETTLRYAEYDGTYVVPAVGGGSATGCSQSDRLQPVCDDLFNEVAMARQPARCVSRDRSGLFTCVLKPMP